ncbi:hypothetical protein V8F33_011665 [Rhypophila sp. PSN 637]
MSNTIDSLYAIYKLVYDPPQRDRRLGTRLALRRTPSRCRRSPKWGSGDDEVNSLGDWLVTETVRLCVDTVRHPDPDGSIKSLLDNIKKPENLGKDFESVVCPGIWYVGDGIPCGASADGRRNGMPIASVPAPQDDPPTPAFRNIYQSMKSVAYKSIEHGMPNASSVDMNIPEQFPLWANCSGF